MGILFGGVSNIRIFARLFTILVSAALAATAAIPTDIPDRPQWNDLLAVENYRNVLYRSYRSCDDLFERHLPPAGLARRCAQKYFLLKLSFLNGVSLEKYFAMEPRDRARANRQGYDAYRAWANARTESLN